MKISTKSNFFLPLMGFISGITNGLLGAGGGIIIVYALNYMLGEQIQDRRDVFANALCVMLPISVVSCIFYATSGNLSISGIGVYSIPAILGGILGALLLSKLKLNALKRLFAGLVIYSGIMLLIK
jgi:uncharacterized membrane protein YfcA